LGGRRETAGLRQQLANRQPGGDGTEFRQIVGYGVVQIQPPLFQQSHHRSRRNRPGHAIDAEDRVALQRLLAPEVTVTPRMEVDDTAMAHDQHHGAEASPPATAAAKWSSSRCMRSLANPMLCAGASGRLDAAAVAQQAVSASAQRNGFMSSNGIWQ
jgi:hypothetical protein